MGDDTQPVNLERPYVLRFPTTLEVQLYRALDQLNVRYTRQEPFGYYTVDAYLPDYALALEADGCFWHGCAVCGYEHDFYIDRMLRDRRRDHRLSAWYNVETLHLPGHAMETHEQALASVRQALDPYLLRGRRSPAAHEVTRIERSL